MSLERRDFLDARDGRQRELERALAAARGRGLAAVVTLGANLPGADKHRPGVARLARAGLAALRAHPGLEPFHQQSDLLGPFAVLLAAGPAEAAKGAALALEAGLAGGRLLDVDVYPADGTQLDRRALGLPPRTCFLCAEPAAACARAGRHPAGELLARADALLRPYRPEPRIRPEALAACLVQGALRELELTPKPGLVDRHDAGSHPDLSYARMRTSIDLLPRFYAELADCAGPEGALEPVVQAGRDAEARMVAAIQANAHKGFIFLSGLVLLAARGSDGRPASLREAIAAFARRFFARFESAASHGGALRARAGLGGIRAEAERGLPAVFEAGWPRYREALEAGRTPAEAGYLLMAVLMQRVEDTTTIRRGGPAALERLRRDGALLQRRLEQGQEVGALLAGWNEEYRQSGLTMGGVADCMALTFALEAAGAVERLD